MKYESPLSSFLKVIARVTGFQKYVKFQGQGIEVKNYGAI